MIELPNLLLLQRVQSSRCYASTAGYSNKTKMALYMHCLKNREGPFSVFQIKYKTDPAEKKRLKIPSHVSKTLHTAFRANVCSFMFREISYIYIFVRVIMVVFP